MRIKFVFAVVTVCLGLLVGCSGAERAEYAAYGKAHRIDRWSGGQIVKTWISTGVVHTEKDTDGYYFQDSTTRVLVRVSGELDITPISK